LIADALMKNDTLKVLDLSFNYLGSTKFDKCGAKFAELFGMDYHIPLIHVDISYNNFSKEDCLLIANGIN
jgi:hypothetical protein